MFSNKDKNSGNKAMGTSASPNALNSLVQGTEIDGQVRAENDIRVDGTIRGSLTCSAKVIIGPTGYVEGQIVCANAIIEGRFEGTLKVKELLNVRKTARMEGEISTEKLIVEAGAIFNVTCKMGQQESHGTTRKVGQKVKLKKEAS